VLDGDFGQAPAAVAARLAQARALAARLAADAGGGRSLALLLGEAGLPPAPTLQPYASVGDVAGALAAALPRAQRGEAFGLRRLQTWLEAQGLGGPAALLTLEPAAPALAEPQALARWSFDPPFEGFGGLPSGPSGAALPWAPEQETAE